MGSISVNMEQQTAMSKKSKSVQTRQAWFDPDKAGYEKLDPLSRRVFNIESQNPGIPVTAIVQVLRRGGWEGSDKTIYRLRDEPEYQFLLKEFQKSELEHWDDIQMLACQRLKSFLNSKSEKFRLEATKFALTHTKEIALAKAKFDFEMEMEKNRIKNPIKHEVKVILDDAIPVVGESVMSDDGKVMTQEKMNQLKAAGKLVTASTPIETIDQEKKQEPSKGFENEQSPGLNGQISNPENADNTESQQTDKPKDDEEVLIQGVNLDDV